jgi:hypothetical protein
MIVLKEKKRVFYGLEPKKLKQRQTTNFDLKRKNDCSSIETPKKKIDLKFLNKKRSKH